MKYRIIRNIESIQNIYKSVENYNQKVAIANIAAQDYSVGETITSIKTTATQYDLKDGDVINIGGQKLIISSDTASTATTLPVESTVLSFPLDIGDGLEIDMNDLFVQYQRKSAGTIAGMPVDGNDLGPINYAAGVYSIIGLDPTYIKILPRDFMVNDDVGSATDTPPAVFGDGTNTGVSVEDASQELIATVNIPYGTTATEVTVWASNTTKDVEVYEMDINANGKGSDIGTGTTNGSAIDITDTAATTTNYLMIIVKVSSTNHRVWGGKVTLTQN